MSVCNIWLVETCADYLFQALTLLRDLLVCEWTGWKPPDDDDSEGSFQRHSSIDSVSAGQEFDQTRLLQASVRP